MDGAVAMGLAKQRGVIVGAGFGGREAAQRLVPGLAEIVPGNRTTTSWLVDPAERDAEGADPAALSKRHQAARASLG